VLNYLTENGKEEIIERKRLYKLARDWSLKNRKSFWRRIKRGSLRGNPFTATVAIAAGRITRCVGASETIARQIIAGAGVLRDETAAENLVEENRGYSSS
jgi:hypothetical protein